MFAEKKINTGRQIEFDYLKGLFCLMIFLFGHCAISPFVCGNGSAPTNAEYRDI